MKKWCRRLLRPMFNAFRDLPMTKKISFAFMLVLIPVVIFVGTWFFNVLQYNEYYSSAVRNTSTISEFSIDFKKNYDYKIYLIIVGNKSFDASNPIADVETAKRIISQVRERTENEQNKQEIVATEKYFDKLIKYTEQIHENLKKGGKYDENNDLWEKDIQPITAAIQENILEILYYETKQSTSIINDMTHMTFEMIIASIILVVFLAGVSILMISIIPRTITRPVTYLSKVTEQVAQGDLTVRAQVSHGAELKVLGKSLNVMIEKTSSLLERVTEEQTLLREAELEILQMQINPHFLYNTLDTIIWLAEADKNEEVVDMVESLSEFFRASLNSGKDIVSLAAETKHIVSYLEIQHVRYQDILDYEIQLPPELDECLIPKITLQPLVENALYHGIKNKRGKGHIRVSGRREGDVCVLVVEDDGIGMTPERLWQVNDGLTHKIEDSHDFYGLYNVNERIRLKFGEQYGLQLRSEYGEGTTVEVMLPFIV